MTQDEIVLAIIRDTVQQMPEDERAKVTAAADELRTILALNAPWGNVALALVGAELAAQS